ncbi:MAG: hypothetical protein AUK27_02290 [Deltaproteobacteria bacterium CG2_30_66_27]|nr:MAG: hypothetical protein AUK27_02290 [Deltaproteobacteria bacterium CG2_30_66_27]PJB32464.1 MAG: hypothetical protein CO109_04535 [Deltaproteobacteria bacterium CG_4_9_14_3_um_filter_65_9]
MAFHGMNVSMSVFIGLSVYGLIKYTDGGFAAARSTPLGPAFVMAVLISVSIAGICFFGHQHDLRKLEEYREEEARKAAEAARKGHRKSMGGGHSSNRTTR